MREGLIPLKVPDADDLVEEGAERMVACEVDRFDAAEAVAIVTASIEVRIEAGVEEVGTGAYE